MYGAFVRYSTDVSLMEYDDAQDYYVTSAGDILLHDEQSGEQKVGIIKLWQLYLEEAAQDNYSILDLLDEDADLQHLIDLFDFSHGCLSKETLSTLGFEEDDFIPLSNLLYIEMVRVEDKFKGMRIGLAAIDHAIRTFGCDLVALVPVPLQFNEDWDGQVCTSYSKADKEASSKALIKHYERAGFSMVPETKVMVKNFKYI